MTTPISNRPSIVWEILPDLEALPQYWDFTRFDVGFFRHLETRIRQLQDIGVEADVILFVTDARAGITCSERNQT